MPQSAVNSINTTILERFSTLLSKERMAHAYLFSGPSGVGKSETALEIAKLVNCQDLAIKPCGQCESCRKIQKGIHPDITRITGSRLETIKIDDVRDLIQRSQLRPFEATKKVFIISNVEYMTTDAGNALLKTLEEPSATSLIILTTAVLDANLDTIRSRCHIVNFFTLSVKDLAQILQSDYDMEHSWAQFTAQFSEGSLGKAIQFNNQKFFKRKNQAIDEIVFGANAETYIKKIAGDKELAKEALDSLWSFYRDVLLFKAGESPNRIIHQDRLGEIKKLAPKYSFEDIDDILREIVKTVRMVRDNFNVKVALGLIKELI